MVFLNHACFFRHLYTFIFPYLLQFKICILDLFQDTCLLKLVFTKFLFINIYRKKKVFTLHVFLEPSETDMILLCR